MNEVDELIFNQSPPRHLYHYSSSAGVLGILESGAVWASSCRSMNDDHEIRHAVNVLVHSFKNHLNTKTSMSHDHVTNASNHLLVLGEKYLGHCAVSFSESGDLLSQWRAYGADGRGISLGFNSVLLSADAHDAGFALGKCIYDYNVQYAICSSFWDKALAGLHLPSLEAGLSLALTSEVEIFLYRAGIFMKNPAFIDEKEWRIVSGENHLYSSQWKYKAKSSGLAAYIVVPLNRLFSAEIDGAPAETIPHFDFTIGPKVKHSPTTIILQSLAQRITGKGHGIGISGVPYID